MSTINNNCFRGSYHEARQCFLEAISSCPPELIQSRQAVQHPLPGSDKEPLYLDWIKLGQSQAPDNLLVLISGTHGVEGFAGSAIQSCVMASLVEELCREKGLGIILLHALNPWGFAWLRRYDHQGIDLNRNFIKFDQDLPENPIYNKLHGDLFGNTGEPVEDCFSRWQATLGEREFDAAITRGQYSYPDGLFYGGQTPCWSRTVLEQLSTDTALQNARQIAVIDLHTGLGPYGYGEVINDHPLKSSGFDRAIAWYGQEARSALLGQSYSAPKTGLLDYFWHDLVGARGCFITLEFGTYALEELLLLTCEEQRYHNSYGTDWQKRDLKNPAVTALHNFFYPRDEKWQLLILKRAKQIISLALQGMNQ